MSSGIIAPDEFPSLSDTRFLLACGPFTIRPISGPDPDTLIFAVAFVSGQNLTQLGLHAQRALEIYLNRGLPTSVDPIDATIPESFSLSQNYPNPFNPSTTIEFSLPLSGHATLKIFDALGREIASLVDGEVRAGTYKATWDAGGNPSGVYYCRLTAGGYSATQKLLLLK